MTAIRLIIGFVFGFVSLCFLALQIYHMAIWDYSHGFMFLQGFFGCQLIGAICYPEGWFALLGAVK